MQPQRHRQRRRPPPSAETREEAARDEPAADPNALGLQVFTEFAAVCARGLADEASATQALEAALADPRLLNFEARALFEWRVAGLLLDGWRPGHEFLFGPACECFDWERDRRRLEMFGPAGAALDAAINEKLIFFRQPPAHFEVQRKLIRGLRDERMPGRRTLIEEMPHLQLLVQRYPHWLRIVTSRENYAKRLQAFEAIPEEERQSVPAFVPPVVSTPPKLPRFSNVHAGWFVIAAFIALVRIVGSLGGAPTYHYTPPSDVNSPVFPSIGPRPMLPTNATGLPGQPADPLFPGISPPVQTPEVASQRERDLQANPAQRRPQNQQHRRPGQGNARTQQGETSGGPSTEAVARPAARTRAAPSPYDLLPPSDAASSVLRLGL